MNKSLENIEFKDLSVISDDIEKINKDMEELKKDKKLYRKIMKMKEGKKCKKI